MRAFFFFGKIKAMDIVYILGTGTTWQNNEIRYSLRSVEKNVRDLDRVFVVGEFPEWLQNVVYIEAGDPYGQKWQNAYHKISEACRDERLSDEFLLMNDDFFIFKEIEAENYPYYYKGSLPSFRKKNWGRFLPQKKMAQDYGIHRPFRYEKRKFLDLAKIEIWWDSFPLRSFYGNYYEVGGVYCKDINLAPSVTEKQIELATKDRTDMSIFSGTAKSPSFRRWINEKFPDKSRFEK